MSQILANGSFESESRVAFLSREAYAGQTTVDLKNQNYMGIQYRSSPARVVVFAKVEKISFRAEVETLRTINSPYSTPVTKVRM